METLGTRGKEKRKDPDSLSRTACHRLTKTFQLFSTTIRLQVRSQLAHNSGQTAQYLNLREVSRAQAANLHVVLQARAVFPKESCALGRHRVGVMDHAVSATFVF